MLLHHFKPRAGLVLLPFKVKSVKDSNISGNSDENVSSNGWCGCCIRRCRKGSDTAMPTTTSTSLQHAAADDDDDHDVALYRREQDQNQDRGKQQQQQKQKPSLWATLKQKQYWPKLLGCAGGWFLFDMTFYGNILFAPTVLKAVFHHQSTVPVKQLVSFTLCLTNSLTP